MLDRMGEESTKGVAEPPRGVRTTKRRGRSSAGQLAALRSLGARWQVTAADVATAPRRAAVFRRSAPLALDIGVGDGRATLAWAAAAPERDVVAIELHRPGLVKLLRGIEADGTGNVRVIEDDALAVLDALEDRSVATVRVLFPDPWPKRRHVARRLVDRSFVERVGELLVDGGELHLATDWADYAEHMRTMVATDPGFIPVTPPHRPARPVTAYERRGLDAGRAITDLVFRFDPSRQRG
jgi:tRNA (guanine-N7-)-methyltransferase